MKHENVKYDPEYISYVRNGDSAAVFIVRDIVNSVDTTNKWIDVLETEGTQNSDGKWDFKSITVELFPRKIKPVYDEFCDKKYVTWQTAHKDIAAQKLEGYKGPIYKITPKLVNKNKGKTVTVEKIWNRSFNQYVPKKWFVKSTCEKRMVKVPMKPDWDYYILEVKKKR